jgi:hypothetical protein
MPHNSSIPSLEREIHLGAPTALEPDSSDLCPMDVDDAKSPDDPFPDFGDLAASPMCRSLPDLHYDVEDPFDGSPFPISPSRRSFADFPEDTTAIEPSRSPPQSRFLRVARPPLLTLPGAEPDNSSQSTDFYCVSYSFHPCSTSCLSSGTVPSLRVPACRYYLTHPMIAATGIHVLCCANRTLGIVQAKGPARFRVHASLSLRMEEALPLGVHPVSQPLLECDGAFGGDAGCRGRRGLDAEGRRSPRKGQPSSTAP